MYAMSAERSERSVLSHLCRTRPTFHRRSLKSGGQHQATAPLLQLKQLKQRRFPLQQAQNQNLNQYQNKTQPQAPQPLPPCLQRGMEALTGVSLQRVRVHYHSGKPAKVQAHAYAQGQNIYLAPGQEAHLPHELGHIVQQAQGRVQATTQVNGIAVNDDPKLEHEATELGNQALKAGRC